MEKTHPHPLTQLFWLGIGLLLLFLVMGLSGCAYVEDLIVGGKPMTYGALITSVLALMFGFSLMVFLLYYLGACLRKRRKKP